MTGPCYGAAPMTTLAFDGLTKRFAGTPAVDGPDRDRAARPRHRLPRAERCRQDHTLRMLLGLVAPTSGTATFDGRRYAELTSPLRAGRDAARGHRLPPRTHGPGPPRVLGRGGGTAAAPRRRGARARSTSPRRRGKRVGRFSLGMRSGSGSPQRCSATRRCSCSTSPPTAWTPQGIRWLRDFLRAWPRGADRAGLQPRAPRGRADRRRRPGRRPRAAGARRHGRRAARGEAGTRVRTPEPSGCAGLLEQAGHTVRRGRRGPPGGERHRPSSASSGRAAGVVLHLLAERSGGPRGRLPAAGRADAVSAGLTALVRAELLKLRTVRLPLTLLLVALGLVTLSVCATVLTAGREGAPARRRTTPSLFRVARQSASAGTTGPAGAGHPRAHPGVPVRHRDAVVPRDAPARAGAGRQARRRRASSGVAVRGGVGAVRGGPGASR